MPPSRIDWHRECCFYLPYSNPRPRASYIH
jgi:hypothetical protein